MSLDIYLKVDTCPMCKCYTEVYETNITHNLNKMADAAGIYGVLWHPEDNGIEQAKHLVEPLIKAISEMKANPDFFKRFDSPNGWGLYVNFLPWLERLLEACKDNPNATIEVSR